MRAIYFANWLWLGCKAAFFKHPKRFHTEVSPTVLLQKALERYSQRLGIDCCHSRRQMVSTVKSKYCPQVSRRRQFTLTVDSGNRLGS